jgi:hypothetical protein
LISFGTRRARLFSGLAFAVLLGLQLLTSWKNLQSIRAAEYNASEPVAEWERRMAPLKRALPISSGMVGYVSDSSAACFDCLNVDDQIEFTLTQYALAPIVVNKGVNTEWVVGNFGKGSFAVWEQAHPGEFSAERFQYGIYLLHRLHP